MTSLLQNIAKDVAYASVGVAVVDAIDLDRKLQLAPNNYFGRHLSYGATFATVSNGIDYATLGQSNLTNMNFLAFGDDVVYNGAFSLGSEVLSTDGMLKDLVSKLGLSESMTNKVTTGAMISTGRLLRTYIDQNQVPSFLKTLAHPLVGTMQ